MVTFSRNIVASGRSDHQLPFIMVSESVPCFFPFPLFCFVLFFRCAQAGVFSRLCLLQSRFTLGRFFSCCSFGASVPCCIGAWIFSHLSFLCPSGFCGSSFCSFASEVAPTLPFTPGVLLFTCFIQQVVWASPGCAAQLAEDGHPACPIHYPCLTEEGFAPTSCPVCAPMVTVLRALPPASRPSCPSFSLLKKA